MAIQNIHLPNTAPTTLVTLTAASASGNSSDQTNNYYSSVIAFVDVTALTGTSPTLTVSIQAKDTVTGSYVTLASTSALSADGEVAVTAPVLGQTWRIAYTIAGTTPAVTATINTAMVV